MLYIFLYFLSYVPILTIPIQHSDNELMDNDGYYEDKDNETYYVTGKTILHLISLLKKFFKILTVLCFKEF